MSCLDCIVSCVDCNLFCVDPPDCRMPCVGLHCVSYRAALCHV